MATIIDAEMLSAAPTSPTPKNLQRHQSYKRDSRPGDRTDLTIEEAERLAEGRPFELIDGRLVFKYPEVLPPENPTPLEERTDVTIEEAEELAQGHSFELIDGRMVFKMADRKHSRIQKILTIKLSAYFEKNPVHPTKAYLVSWRA